MNALLFASGRFDQAVKLLATGTKPLEDRVVDAFQPLLDVSKHAETLPDGIREGFEEYYSEYDTWADDLTEEKAIEVANWIVEKARELDARSWGAGD